MVGYRPEVINSRHSHFTKEEEDEVAENLQEIYDQEGYRVRNSRGISSIVLGNESSVIDGRYSSSFSAYDEDGFVSVEVGPKCYWLISLLTIRRMRFCVTTFCFAYGQCHKVLLPLILLSYM